MHPVLGRSKRGDDLKKVRFACELYREAEGSLLRNLQFGLPEFDQLLEGRPQRHRRCYLQGGVGGGVRIHPENARLSGRHGVQ